MMRILGINFNAFDWKSFARDVLKLIGIVALVTVALLAVLLIGFALGGDPGMGIAAIVLISLLYIWFMLFLYSEMGPKK